MATTCNKCKKKLTKEESDYPLCFSCEDKVAVVPLLTTSNSFNTSGGERAFDYLRTLARDTSWGGNGFREIIDGGYLKYLGTFASRSLRYIKYHYFATPFQQANPVAYVVGEGGEGSFYAYSGLSEHDIESFDRWIDNQEIQINTEDFVVRNFHVESPHNRTNFLVFTPNGILMAQADVYDDEDTLEFRDMFPLEHDDSVVARTRTAWESFLDERRRVNGLPTSGN